MKTSEHNFVTYLESLAQADDRGALAALRRGLGQPPGTVPDMFRYVIPRLPENAYPGSWTEKTYYLIASLFALHPKSAPEGNLGDHFAALRDPDPDKNAALERRFTAILNANPDDLPDYLRQAISFLRSKDETPVNWHELMWHLLQMGDPERADQIRKRWATAFWRNRSRETEQPNIESTPTHPE